MVVESHFYKNTSVRLWVEGFLQKLDSEQLALFDFLGQVLSSSPRVTLTGTSVRGEDWNGRGGGKLGSELIQG